MKKEEKSIYGFKDYSEVIKKADSDTPATMGTLRRIDAMHDYPIKTKEDVRFYVLMNHIRSIHETLNKGLDMDYLRRIQDNILFAAEKFLK